jgi:hypothetical protein
MSPLRDWLRRERRTIRMSGGGDDEGWREWVPPVPSCHDDLLAGFPAASTSWSAAALRACLEAVRDGVGAERVAVTDAWVDGDEAFCVIYAPPWLIGTLAGLRRARSDVASDTIYQTLDDPADFGHTVTDWDLSEPLGRRQDELRYDADGLGWWGTLEVDLR